MQRSNSTPTARRVLAWVKAHTGPLRPLHIAPRCSQCHRARALPYKAYCTACHAAYQRWYYWRTRPGAAPATVERYREAFQARAGLRLVRPHLPLGTRWCSYHRRGCPMETFTHNRCSPDGLEQYCREARREWSTQHQRPRVMKSGIYEGLHHD